MAPAKVGCVWGQPPLSQGSVPVGSGLHLVGQLKTALGKAPQIRDAVMFLWDAVEVWQDWGTSRPRPRPD